MIAVLFVGNFGYSQVVKFELDKYGGEKLGDHKRKFGLPLYLEKKNIYYAELPIRFFGDTMQLRITKKKDSYFPKDIECVNQKENSWKFSYDKEKRLITITEGDLKKVMHLYDLPSSEGRLVSVNSTNEKIAVDTSEWIGVERKRIMYGDIKIEGGLYSIAIQDLNVISPHGYDIGKISIEKSGSRFKAMIPNARCNFVSETKYLDFHGNYFEIIRIEQEFIEIEKCNEIVEDSCIYIDTHVRATSYVFEGDDLDYRSFLEDGKYLVLSIFSEYCPPCIKDFPKLNNLQKKYKEKITILGLFDGQQKDLTRLEETFSVIHPLGILNPEIKRDVLQHAVPYKVVISPEGEIIKFGIRSTEKLEELLDSLF